ncbi:MAG TPA: cytochrome C oxidase subunit IV family protein [Brumimicrobium sp.]|nr:cytochrome C oxidase subunit IV family protein [Brumimicrobium sp.]
MKNSLTNVYIALIILTLAASFLSGAGISTRVVITIILISIVKFIAVGFEFMELKKAHRFWKTVFIIYSLVIGGLFMILLG